MSITGVPGKSTTFTQEVVNNTLWHQVADYFLTNRFGPYWVSALDYLYLSIPAPR